MVATLVLALAAPLEAEVLPGAEFGVDGPVTVGDVPAPDVKLGAVLETVTVLVADAEERTENNDERGGELLAVLYTHTFNT